VALLGFAVPAHGVTLAEKRAEAARIQAQVDELDTQVEVASEEYNEAKVRYEEISAAVKANEARLAELVARQDTLQSKLATRVQGMYRQGALGYIEVLLGAASFEEFATVWDLLQDMNTADAATVAELRKTRAEVERVKEELAVQQAEAKAEADTMAAKKTAVERQLDERKRLLSSVKQEIQAILDEQARAAAAAAEAAAVRARAEMETRASSSGAEEYSAPTGAAHSDVVSIAMSKLGSPYQWAASGPSRFDCSGFTMWCYRQIGISLPHSSRSQINCGERVSRANLQPGDLVFFGSPIHHVGIYIGGNQYIHAPRTGDVVKISSLAGRSDYAGACRP